MNKLYPDSFFQYANDSRVAVKKISDTSSGWTGDMINTSLIMKMDALIEDIKSKKIEKPFSIYLVGGPGNGKTAAAEYFVKKLYNDVMGKECIGSNQNNGRLRYDDPISDLITGVILVEDATSASNTKESVAGIIKEANELVLSPKTPREIYICCVNRGILSDCSRENNSDNGVAFLEKISHTVAVSTESSPVWPLAGNKYFNGEDFLDSVYVWPMDIESLLDEFIYGDYDKTPAASILSKIFDQDVEHCTTCPNNDYCPFFFNYKTLQESENRKKLIQVLHEFEIAIGKKLLFRDLFSVYNILLVGDENDYKSEALANIGQKAKKISPCEWVAQEVNHIRSKDNKSLAAAFRLASKQYHYILFGNWKEFRGLDYDLKDTSFAFVKLTNLFDAVAKKDKGRKKTSNAWELIHETFSQIMDVAFVEEREELEALEEAFSSSFSLGFDKLNEKLKTIGEISPVEDFLFSALEEQEKQIENEDFQVASPEERTASKYLRATKVLGCRLAKRTVGIKIPTVCNGAEIETYCKLIQGKDLHEMKIVRDIMREILFGKNEFAISMMHNFAQNDPCSKKFYLLPEKLSIKPFPITATGANNRAISNSFVLRIEKTNIEIPVSFELYLALKQFHRGISIAALPEQVFVLLNIISSKILGCLIHSDDEDLRFRLGERDSATFEKIGDELMRENI